MSKMMIKTSLISLFAFIAVQKGDALSCFQCNSNTEKDCADLTKDDINSQHYKPCADSVDGVYCRKTHLKILVEEHVGKPHERIIRSCAHLVHPNKPCYKATSFSHQEVVCHCSEDGCNHAPSSFQTSMIAWTTVSALMLRWMLT